MSKFVKVKTELRDLALIKQALDDLKLSYEENEAYTHVWSGFRGTVPLVVREPRAFFGFRLTRGRRLRSRGRRHAGQPDPRHGPESAAALRLPQGPG